MVFGMFTLWTMCFIVSIHVLLSLYFYYDYTDLNYIEAGCVIIQNSENLNCYIHIQSWVFFFSFFFFFPQVPHLQHTTKQNWQEKSEKGSSEESHTDTLMIWTQFFQKCST